MRILAIETSCDESAVAVLDEQRGLLAHELWSQIDLHRAFGGVVPELASRDHLRRLLPLLRTALERAATAPSQIEGVAYTAGPGLIGALLTGAALARALSFRLGRARRSASIIWRAICWRRCSETAHAAVAAYGTAGVRRPHDADRGARASATIACSARPATMRPARHSTRRAKLLGLPYPGGPRTGAAGRPRAAGASSDFRGRCSIGRASSSVSPG